MKRIFFTVITVFAVFQAFGQDDNIENQILNYDSKSIIISRGRGLLLDKFLEKDMDKVKEIKNYLIEKGEDENYMALYPAEYWLVLYWTNEYEELLSDIKALGSTTITSPDRWTFPQYDMRIRPQPDMLYKELKSKLSEDSLYIVDQIRNADMDIEMKELLQLHFESLIRDDASFRDTLNMHADHFLETYPQTEYEGFVRQYIRYKFVPDNWGFALEFFSGYGVFTGTLNNNYTNNLPLGFAFDVCYKKFELYLRGYVGFNQTKTDFAYSTGIYKKGSSSTVTIPEATLGYVVLDNDRFKIAPYAGIGGMNIAATSAKTDEIPELKEISKSVFAYNLGVNFDIKLGKKEYSFYPKSSYGFVRVRYGYCLPKFSKKYGEISGGMHYITVGIGLFGRAVRREY